MAKGFCTNCGAEIKEDATFCVSCGSPVAPSQPVQTAAPVQNPFQQAPQMPQASQTPQTSQMPRAQTLSQQAPSAHQSHQQGASAQKKPMAIIVIAAIVIVVAVIAIVLFAVLPAANGPRNSSSGPAASSMSSSGNAGSATGGNTPPVFPSVTVSTQLPADADTADYGVVNLIDGNSETAWNEGAPGDGEGEWMRFSASAPQRVSAVRIMGGFPKLYKDGSDVYAKNPRPRDITISYNGGSQNFTMQDLRGQFQTFTLSMPVDTTEITITIDSVYPGTKYHDCCVAEVEFQ